MTLQELDREIEVKESELAVLRDQRMKLLADKAMEVIIQAQERFEAGTMNTPLGQRVVFKPEVGVALRRHYHDEIGWTGMKTLIEQGIWAQYKDVVIEFSKNAGDLT